MSRTNLHPLARTFGLAAFCFVAVHPVSAQPKAPSPTVTGDTSTGPARIIPTPWFTSPQIRQQVKFSDDQVNRLSKAYESNWAEYNRNVRELNKALTDQQRSDRIAELQQKFHRSFASSTGALISDPIVRQRFEQLSWQYRGYGALQDPKVQQRLKLTPEQTEKLRHYAHDWSTQMSELNTLYPLDRELVRQRFIQMQSEARGYLTSLLTPEQQQTWRRMVGDSYTFSPDLYFQENATIPRQKP